MTGLQVLCIFMAVAWPLLMLVNAFSFADEAARWCWPRRYVLPYYEAGWKINATIGLFAILVGGPLSIVCQWSLLPAICAAVAGISGTIIERTMYLKFKRLFA